MRELAKCINKAADRYYEYRDWPGLRVRRDVYKMTLEICGWWFIQARTRDESNWVFLLYTTANINRYSLYCGIVEVEICAGCTHEDNPTIFTLQSDRRSLPTHLRIKVENFFSRELYP